MADISETWIGTNGAAWPSPWTATTTGGSVTIQSNQGRIVTSTTVWSAHRAARPGLANGDLYLTVTLASVSVEHYVEILFRESSPSSFGTGYSLSLDPLGGAIQLLRWAGGEGSDTEIDAAAFSFTAGTPYRIRIRWAGSTLQAKIWAAAGSEPGSWLVEAVDATYSAAGYLQFQAMPGTSSARTVDFDNLQVTDLDALSGALAATMPAPAAALAATVTDLAALAATTPAPTAALAATVTALAELAAAMPDWSAELAATVTTTGQIAATMPAPEAALEGMAEEPGDLLSATMPALQAELTGTVTAHGVLTASMPAPTATMEATVTTTAELSAQMPAWSAALTASIPIPDLLRLNGLDIRRHAHRPRDLSTLLRVAQKRGSDLVIPGAHGELRIPAKRYDANLAALPLLVLGVDPDTGLVPDDTTMRQQMIANIDALVEAIGDEELHIAYTRPDGSEREITGEVLEVIEPRAAPPGTIAELDVVIRLHDPFWRDPSDVVSGNVVSGTTGVTAQLGGFAGATAPMEDLLVEIGPCSNPKIEQPATGTWVEWDGVIGAGQTLRIWTHDDQWRITGTGGLTVAPADFAHLSYGGSRTRRWFALHPEPGGPTVKLTHTGGGSGSATITITGRRKYKTA